MYNLGLTVTWSSLLAFCNSLLIFSIWSPPSTAENPFSSCCLCSSTTFCKSCFSYRKIKICIQWRHRGKELTCIVLYLDLYCIGLVLRSHGIIFRKLKIQGFYQLDESSMYFPMKYVLDLTFQTQVNVLYVMKSYISSLLASMQEQCGKSGWSFLMLHKLSWYTDGHRLFGPDFSARSSWLNNPWPKMLAIGSWAHPPVRRASASLWGQFCEGWFVPSVLGSSSRAPRWHRRCSTCPRSPNTHLKLNKR